MVKYVHDEDHHNLIAPSIIVPYIIEAVNPQSVVDVGCGIGTFLNVFNTHGINDILGLDGEWTNKELLSKYIDLDSFKVVNLEEKFYLDKKFDVAICLEVAEHLSENSADTIVYNLANLSDIIVFSAAFPGQGGQNHLNEQWPSYWAEKFKEHGYTFHDVLRPIFWNETEIPDWYKQNMFLVLKNGVQHDIVEKLRLKSKAPLINFIHPNYFNAHLERSNKLEPLQKDYAGFLKGKSGFVDYTKVMAKYLLRNLGLYKK